jgi:diacylglycerol kinase (ATP)
MKSDKPFSIQARLKSFVYAFEGIKAFLRYEPQALIHVIAASAVIIGGFYFEINHHEWIAVVFAIGIVVVSEMLNTAIEKLTDMVSPEIHPQAKVVKDLAAGAVLMASMVAAVIGLLVFLPKVI